MVKRIKPVSRTIKIEAEIKKIFEEAFIHKKDLLGLDESWVPCVDVSERRNDLFVEVELPGVEEKDIRIMLYPSRLEIKGNKKERLPDAAFKFLRLEREYGYFRRFVFLPRAVWPGRAKASLENGVLTIQLKKLRSKGEKEVIVEIE
jgi:HSP20 family protein